MQIALIVLGVAPSCQKRPVETSSQWAEQIPNGDFEGGTQGWTGGDATLAIAESGNSGKCLALVRTAGIAPYAIQLDTLLLEPDARYRLVFYVKAGSSGTGDPFRVGIWDNHATNWAVVKAGRATAEWVRYEVPFIATGKNRLSPELIKDSPKEGNMLFDSVALKKLGEYESYVQNGDFEDGVDGWSAGTGALTAVPEGESGKCARLSGAGPGWFIQMNVARLKVGANYDFAFSVKSGSENSEGFQAGVWDGKNMKWTAVKSGTANSAWQRYTVPFTNSTAEPVGVEFMKSGASQGAILVDSVFLALHKSK